LPYRWFHGELNFPLFSSKATQALQVPVKEQQVDKELLLRLLPGDTDCRFKRKTLPIRMMKFLMSVTTLFSRPARPHYRRGLRNHQVFILEDCMPEGINCSGNVLLNYWQFALMLI